MAKTAADVLIDTIHDWGVEVIFGLPGDGINGIMEALRKRQDEVRFVHVRHEESAAFMACAYAKLDGQPVLALTGLAYHDLINTHQQQDVELDKLFIDVAVYNNRIMSPSHVQPSADLAIRTALKHRGVAHLTIPSDTQETELDEHSPRNVPHHTSDVWATSAALPNSDDLRRAAEILNSGRKVAILAGRGALDAGDQLEDAAEMLGAPIVKALLGKACVPDDSPYTTGGIGLLGTEPSQDALEACDTLLIVGTSFPYIEFYPKPGEARAVQIDTDPARIGLRYPVEVGLVGDSRATLQALLPMLSHHEDRNFLKQAQDGMGKWRETIVSRATRQDTPMKPQVVAHELGLRLRDDAIIFADSGTIATWAARHVHIRRGQMFSL